MHAQAAGAKAVIIANNGDVFVTPTGDEETVMKIHIPSLLISADDTKSFASMKGQDIRVELDWTVKRASHLDWQLWSTTFDADTLQVSKGHVNRKMREFAIPANLLRQFELIDGSLQERASFTPRYFIVPGRDQCGVNRKKQCGQQCIGEGNYCMADPDGNPSKGRQGADVLREDLRQLCIWRWCKKGKGATDWWIYVGKFSRQCKVAQSTADADAAEGGPTVGEAQEICSTSVQKAMGIDERSVQACVDGAIVFTKSSSSDEASAELSNTRKSDLFGQFRSEVDEQKETRQTGGGSTSIPITIPMFDAEIRDDEAAGVVYPPKLVVNGEQYFGRLDCPEKIRVATCPPLRRLCAGLTAESRRHARGCSDTYWEGMERVAGEREEEGSGEARSVAGSVGRRPKEERIGGAALMRRELEKEERMQKRLDREEKEEAQEEREHEEGGDEESREEMPDGMETMQAQAEREHALGQTAQESMQERKWRQHERSVSSQQHTKGFSDQQWHSSTGPTTGQKQQSSQSSASLLGGILVVFAAALVYHRTATDSASLAGYDKVLEERPSFAGEPAEPGIQL
jgi:hypothetical protein